MTLPDTASARGGTPAARFPILMATALLVALCLGHAPARAQVIGLDLSWDDCGVAGNLNKDFACDSNAGTSVLVPSVGFHGESPVYVRSVIVFYFDGAVPNWWALQPGACRDGGLTVTAAAPGLVGCVDYWGARQAMSLANWSVITSSEGPIGYKIDMVVWIDPQFAEPVENPTEIYSGVVRIDHRRTASADSCAGCSIRGGFTYTQATIATVETPGEIITSPFHRNYVLWQDGIVPTRRQTWGGVKALFK